MHRRYTLLNPLLRLVRSHRFRRWLCRRIGPPASSRIVLHVGPHKTGTTSIQFFAERNRFRFPLTHDVVRRTDPELAALTAVLRGLTSSGEVDAALPRIRELAAALATKCRFTPVTLISQEDLLGALPSRTGLAGLYDLVPRYLPELLGALASHGARIDVVFYLREWEEWAASVHRQRHYGDASADYDPEAFSRAHRFPEGWAACLERLRRATAPHAFHVLSFDEDRREGFLGLQILRLMGLTNRQIAHLRRTPPRNVRCPGTLAGPRG